MSYQVSFLWKNEPRFRQCHYLFETASMAEAYAEGREGPNSNILDWKITSRLAKATHIFADGKPHTIHSSVDAWKTILEDGEKDGQPTPVA